MPTLTRLALLALACWSMALSRPVAAYDSDLLRLSDFPRERIVIATRASFRQPVFEAWRAETERERAQGLMFVEDGQMSPDQAMLFVYDQPQYVSMWMKNTLLSLDMLFADAGGCIVTVKERTTPFSLAEIRSGKRVTMVVELKAGTVARHGIGVGDRVLRPDMLPGAADGITCASAPATR
jgi:uncharacterized membrane protein (UPF0127 family)